MPPATKATEVIWPESIDGYNKTNLDAVFKSPGGQDLGMDISVNDDKSTSMFMSMTDIESGTEVFTALTRDQAISVFYRMRRVMVAIGVLVDDDPVPEDVDEREHLPELDAIDRDLEACRER